jgi:hypothetical protein
MSSSANPSKRRGPKAGEPKALKSTTTGLPLVDALSVNDQEVARQAIREYVENHSRRELLDRVLDEELPRYAEALERLGR